MKYTTLFFDMDGTILDYRKTEAAALFKAWDSAFGGTPPAELKEVYHSINSSLWEKFEKKLVSLEALKHERFSRLFSYFNLEFDADEFSRIYLEELGSGGYLIPGALDVLNACRNRFRMGAVTNGISAVQRSRLKKAGIEGFFETLVISSETGIAKPDPEIFFIAMRDMELDSTEGILMIGDSLASDIQGGINAGIDTCWIGSSGDIPDDIEPSHVISDITELLNILD